MPKALRASFLAAAAWLAACSGDSSSPPPPPDGTFTLSGTITATAATAADGDTHDPSAPVAHNDTPATAQQLPSAVTVGGWASASADAEDWYRATLAAGQVVTLRIADEGGGANDLDLCIYTAAAARVTCSAGTGAIETWQATSGGTYLVEVSAYSGASSYVLSIAQAPLAVAAPGALRLDAEFVPGEVLVRFQDAALPAGADGPRVRGLAARAAAVGLEPLGGDEGRELRLGLGSGAARARALERLGVRGRLRDLASDAVDPLASARADTIEAIKALRRRADVASADPNYVFRPSLHPALVPNDTHWSKQWDLVQMKLPGAWDVTTGSPASGEVVVAVIDTGVFLAHPDLSAKLVAGYDFISSTSISNDGNGIDANPDDPGDDPDPRLASFHGTHVAGTVAADTNNALGVAGVSWGARIMPVRALGVGGGTTADIIEAVRFAAGLSNASGTVPARRADVLNLSFGCASCFSSTEQAVYDAVRAAGVIVVAAAGNEDTSTLSYPASYAGVISVAAVGPTGTKASYSNFGAAIDVAAPGGDQTAQAPEAGIPSTWVDASSGTRAASYAWASGTSMAAPHVAGLLALMKAVCPTLTPVQVDAFLAAGGMTDEAGAAGRDTIYGWGVVNAEKAVKTASAECTPAGLGATPSHLEFAPGTATLAVTPAAVGGTGLTGAVTASDDASWLTLATPGGDGLGAWTASVNRGSLAAGDYSATITFSAPVASGTVTARVPVTLQVGGTAAGAGSAGYLRVRLLDASSSVVAVQAGSPSAGAYPYSFAGLAAGSYVVRASTDLDGDGVLCDAGEACAAAPVSLSADTAGVDFTVGFDVDLGIAGAARPAPGKAVQP